MTCLEEEHYEVSFPSKNRSEGPEGRIRTSKGITRKTVSKGGSEFRYISKVCGGFLRREIPAFSRQN